MGTYLGGTGLLGGGGGGSAFAHEVERVEFEVGRLLVLVVGGSLFGDDRSALSGDRSPLLSDGGLLGGGELLGGGGLLLGGGLLALAVVVGRSLPGLAVVWRRVLTKADRHLLATVRVATAQQI